VAQRETRLALLGDPPFRLVLIDVLIERMGGEARHHLVEPATSGGEIERLRVNTILVEKPLGTFKRIENSTLSILREPPVSR
jgi:hypothetical protein